MSHTILNHKRVIAFFIQFNGKGKAFMYRTDIGKTAAGTYYGKRSIRLTGEKEQTCIFTTDRIKQFFDSFSHINHHIDITGRAVCINIIMVWKKRRYVLQLHIRVIMPFRREDILSESFECRIVDHIGNSVVYCQMLVFFHNCIMCADLNAIMSVSHFIQQSMTDRC